MQNLLNWYILYYYIVNSPRDPPPSNWYQVWGTVAKSALPEDVKWELEALRKANMELAEYKENVDLEESV